MNEDTLRNFITEIFEAWKNSIYYDGPLDEKVKRLQEYEKSYLELASRSADS